MYNKVLYTLHIDILCLHKNQTEEMATPQPVDNGQGCIDYGKNAAKLLNMIKSHNKSQINTDVT